MFLGRFLGWENYMLFNVLFDLGVQINCDKTSTNNVYKASLSLGRTSQDIWWRFRGNLRYLLNACVRVRGCVRA